MSLLLVSAGSVNKLDSLIKVRPLGDKVSPCLMGSVLLIASAFVADWTGHRQIANGLMPIGLGLGAGALIPLAQGKAHRLIGI